MRVLSPRIEPCVRVLDGSTASTATFAPPAIRCIPSASSRVDLPAPGAPVMPMRRLGPCGGGQGGEQGLGQRLVLRAPALARA